MRCSTSYGAPPFWAARTTACSRSCPTRLSGAIVASPTDGGNDDDDTRRRHDRAPVVTRRLRRPLVCLLRHWTWADEAMSRFRPDLEASLPHLRACRALLAFVPDSLEEQP